MPIKTPEDIRLILSAVRALTGAIPPTLVSVSVEHKDNILYWQCVFDENASENEIELLTTAAAEFISDFPDQELKETYLRKVPSIVNTNLTNLVYLRYEVSTQ
jgi:hypothetical protein